MDPDLNDVDPNDDDMDPDEGQDHEDDDDRDDDPDAQRRQRTTKSAARAIRRERAKVRQLEATVSKLQKAIEKGGIGTEPPKDKVDVDALRKQLMEEVKAEVSADANARILVTEAKTALKEAGFTGRAERGVRLLDLDDLDPNSATFTDDLLERIEELEEESPGLFKRRARSDRDSGRDNARRSSRRRDDDDEEDDERDSSNRNRRSSRSEGMTRQRGGGSNPDSLERALRQLVGAPRNRE